MNIIIAITIIITIIIIILTIIIINNMSIHLQVQLWVDRKLNDHESMVIDPRVKSLY
jgi:hypothetical protein